MKFDVCLGEGYLGSLLFPRVHVFDPTPVVETITQLPGTQLLGNRNLCHALNQELSAKNLNHRSYKGVSPNFGYQLGGFPTTGIEID